MNIGIIAEDNSDVSVVRELTLTILRPRRIGFNHFVGHGCGKLRRKCSAWATNLVRRGCPWIVVVHDLDINDERQLKSDLLNEISGSGASAQIVLLPKREIEAWLLYDADAIAEVFSERTPLRLTGDPENLPDPKNYLGTQILRQYHKRYLSTVHNEQIARKINVRQLERSNSFAPHLPFVSQVRRSFR